jgi:hypothetical protein
VSEFIGLNAKQLKTVQRLGFCDPAYDVCDCNDDGLVYMDDQTVEFTSVDGYQDAFVNLAILGGEPNAIDSLDLAILEEKKVLAEVIAHDPAYKVIVLRGTALEHNRKEVGPGGLTPGIPPRHYKRLTYYCQMALAKIVDPSLVPDGVYGDDTKRVVEIFQVKADIRNENGKVEDGTLLGRTTIGTLVMRLRYSMWKMVSMLAEDADFLAENGPFMIDGPSNGHKEVYDHFVLALKWLGYVNESYSNGSKEPVRRAMAEHFKEGVTKVGPMVMGWIIDRIKAQTFETKTAS